MRIIDGKELFLQNMQVHTDQLGNQIQLAKQPQRIISLVPSQSEFLWDLGLHKELVGITKFCIHPQTMFQSLARVGGTKQLDLDKIRELKPDLIIGNKEENDKKQIELLQKEFPVWMSDISSFEDTYVMMKELGILLFKKTESEQMIKTIHVSLSAIKQSFQQQRVLYLMWNEPYMGAASDTFIHHVLQHVGLENVLRSYHRYPELSTELIQTLKPDFCFLSSEPYPFKDKHVEHLKKIIPQAQIVLVDGEMFSWYGSRLLYLENYITTLKQHLL